MLRPIQPGSRATVIWTGDPAIDDEASEIVKYDFGAAKDPGCWRDLIKPRASEKVTQFIIAPIPPGEMSRIDDDSRGADGGRRMTTLFWECFKYGLVDIKDSGFGDITTVGSGDGERVDPDWIEKTFVRGLRDAGLYVGAFCFRWNRMTEDDAKN